MKIQLGLEQSLTEREKATVRHLLKENFTWDDVDEPVVDEPVQDGPRIEPKSQCCKLVFDPDLPHCI